MCGIAGAVGHIDIGLESAVRAMTDAQAHRGPDQAGFFSTGSGPGVAFGFRRLAIIDLSPGGHQPMTDAARKNVIVFNGEIYNHLELRTELASLGERFESTSDTEVLLKSYGRWGSECLPRLRGMFAFAIFDAARRSIFFARDRLGIKPLYFANAKLSSGPVLLFASELRALLASELVPRRLDRTAVASYVWNGFVVGPTTMIENAHLLSPGHCMTVSIDAPAPRPVAYWSLGEHRRDVRPEDARAHLEHELSTAAEQHLMSDVPLGVFLSGGVDSSAVTALAVRASRSQVRTFHVSFDEAKFDESRYASAVAKALGTEHAEFRLTQKRFRAGLEQAVSALDQPTFDAINTYFVSRVVREAGFKVALAGTGGDELFGGYRSFRDLPRATRASLAARLLPDALLAQLARATAKATTPRDGVPSQVRWGKLGDLLLGRGDPVTAYQVAYALFTRDFQAELSGLARAGLAPDGLPPERCAELRRALRGESARSGVGLLELALFLGERLLRDSDAASMAVSLELRVPLLDHGVVEAACSMPDRERFEPLGKKRLLRSIALADLPSELFERPKAGFVLPIEVWAKDDLGDDLAATFANGSLARSVGLEPRTLERLLRSFRSGNGGIYWSRVWAPYVLLRWCEAHRVALA